ncbi:MAG: M20/M25/M40 family metallo-hydrolase [Firmicutes bacterium]|nr:M20/M25/M40 family metallo-hydrolase [Bacillota bacterium]
MVALSIDDLALEKLPHRVLKIKGSFRCSDERVREKVAEDTPILRNDPDLAALARQIVTETWGREALAADQAPESGSDDFAFLCVTGIPCFYFMLGAYLSEENSSHHHPLFDLDERQIVNAARLLALMAKRLGV